MSTQKLWYNKPADSWSEGFPVGNGRLAAIVYGGAEQEVWNITESTYWSGKRETITSQSSGKDDLARLRQHFFDGDYEGGERLASQLLEPGKANFGTNLPVCDVILKFKAGGQSVTRELNLENAITKTTYEFEGAKIHRELFASHADGLIVCRLWSEQPEGISFSLQLEGKTDYFDSWNEPQGEGRLSFKGQALEKLHSDGECGVRCQGSIHVETQGGLISGDAGWVEVSNAKEAIIYFAINTDYGVTGDDWLSVGDTRNLLAKAKGYESLKLDHIADYSSLYDRASLELGTSEQTSLPTDERIRNVSQGKGEDPALFALFFQYGRYLTLCGAREDSPLPLHLQGIWNDDQACRMGWTCDYHIDINTQMNYYPTEMTHLSESHQPLIRYIEQLAESGKAAARDFYGSDGWVAHTVSNAWGFTAPAWQNSWGLNVTGGLWIAMQLRDHYEYTLNEQFLSQTAYPILKDAALFFLDYMALHPQYGWLVTGPSISPENTFHANGTQVHHYLSMGTTLDQVLVSDLFEFVLESAEKLAVDEQLQADLQKAIALLPPLQIGEKGQLQEWLEDYVEAQPEHRHLSHLHSLFPAYRITPQHTPELSEAARVTLEARKSTNNHEDVEFTVAAFAGCYSRLHDGENAYEQISHLVGNLCFDNLLTFSKPGIGGAESPIYVADGNFGGTAAIADMLLQSHAGELHLLPALPASWSSGQYRGLRARGALEVDVTWSEGRLVAASVRALATGHTTLRYGEQTLPFNFEAGRSYSMDSELRIQ
ncbi:alpha-L-fucosidase [Bacillus sp. FJAT-27264]|uniref:glycoside hydrolase family 95 protein n=1 Tax=Paenibacillus sp. (strain DSM 101736 / FJAT-27264) TaxID=1850362 RepID=UPI000807FDD5|nr:glycoside hydrolase family 95 protein [Bacillus sp. FJAT-27264]OBZ19356.1 alpha-L-fucosidase [Bacillus sp. FJAT-27264]